MSRSPTPVENIAVRLIFACRREERYNRTYEDYMRIASELPCLKELHHQVNRLLKERLKLYGPPYEICRFKAGDKRIRFEPFPESISRETIRTALIAWGMRQPRRKRTRH